MAMIATCHGCLHLFEYGTSQTSGLHYFREEFTINNPKLFYSLSVGINPISGKISKLCESNVKNQMLYHQSNYFKIYYKNFNFLPLYQSLKAEVK